VNVSKAEPYGSAFLFFYPSYTHPMKKIETVFADKVRAVVRQIPVGTVMTYGAVATKAGYPGAARAVGAVMKDNYDLTVPCHRVIRSDGTLGEYNRGGPAAKRALLMREGALKAEL
jgi:O-6-methylguanine DNA methyltransferase